MINSLFGLIAAVLYMAAFVASGQLVARAVFPKDCRLVRVWLGCAIALVMLLWLPALFSFALGFTLAAQLLAAAACALIGLVAWKRTASPLQVLRTPSRRVYLMAVLPVLALLAYLLHTHTLLKLANGALASGQSTFGDMCMHLGIITSISRQGFFPPQYSILNGAPMSYPFLCDSISSTFYTLGASLRASYMLPMLLAFFSVVAGVYLFFEDWFKRADKAALAFVLFFIGGGFGFAYFFDGAAANLPNLTRAFTAFYETPTNLVSENLRWVNVIADMLIPQRATLFGWALLFPCLFLLRRCAFDERDDFVFLGIMAGALPLVHTHSFLALGLVSAVWFLRALRNGQGIKRFALYGVIAVLLALPQLLLFTFKQAGGFLQFNFNWANQSDFFLWFYVKNLGLIFILLPVALLCAQKRDRQIWGGVLLLWILAELVQFQPNEYDNNKLLFIWYAFTCGIVASFLVDAYAMLSGLRGRRLLAAFTIIALTLSGILTLGRECVSQYELFSQDELDAARFIDEQLPANAVFLTATNHDNPVSTLTGRNLVCGCSSYLFYHGFNTAEREADVRLMFEEPTEHAKLFDKYDVDYVYIGQCEMCDYAVSHSDFEEYRLVFANSAAAIYEYKAK